MLPTKKLRLPKWFYFVIFCLFITIISSAQSSSMASGETFAPPPQESFPSLSQLPPPPSTESKTQAQAIVSAALEFNSAEAQPGEQLELTIRLTNDGALATQPYSLELRLGEGLAVAGKTGEWQASAKADGVYTLLSQPLNPTSTQEWIIPVEVSQEINAHPQVSLYASHTDVKKPHHTDAQATLLIKGIAESEQMLSSNTAEQKGWMPNFVAPTSSLFSGAATYGYGFETAPGRGGLQPGLGVNYNSKSVTSGTYFAHSGEVGEGWSLSGISSITRQNVKPCPGDNPTTICVINSFSLVLNGASHDLVYTGSSPYGLGIYQAIGEPSLYIERRNAQGGNGSPANVTGEYWLVRTPNGTTYRFGYTDDAEQILIPTNSTADATIYTGQHAGVSAYRWWVDQVNDIHGNYMAFHYLDGLNNSNPYFLAQNACNTTINRCREVATYLDLISYNNAVSGTPGSWQSTVELYYVYSGAAIVNGISPIFSTAMRLQTVTAKHSGQTLWSYALGYTVSWHPNSTNVASLDSIQQRDFNTSNQLPPTTFTYENLDNGYICLINPPEGVGCPIELQQHFFYPHLKTVVNGYGGVYELTYSAEKTVVYIKAWDGVKNIYSSPNPPAPTMQWEYIYTNPCISAWNACHTGAGEPNGQIVGYGNVTTLTKDGAGVVLAQSRSQFQLSNISVWLGKNLWQGNYHPNNAILSETFNTWTDRDGVNPNDNREPGCPTNGLSFDYVCQVKSLSRQYYYPPNEPVRNIETFSFTYHDPVYQDNRQWGLVTRQDVYFKNRAGVETKHNTQQTWYKSNLTNWVVVPWTTFVQKPDNSMAQLSLSLYDGQTDPDNQTIGLGKLSLSRAVLLTDLNSGTPVEYNTVDATYSYDGYGNLTQMNSYKGYGRVGYTTAGNWDINQPAGNGSTALPSITGYTNYGLQVDYTRTPLYPSIPQTDMAYHGRFFWLPVMTQEPSGLQTTYEYDTMGRLIKIAQPGDSLANPTLQYSYPSGSVTAPFAITQTTLPNNSALSQQSIQYFNGLGQLLQTTQVGVTVDGVGLSNLVTKTGYDALGRTVCQTASFESASTAYLGALDCTNKPHSTTVYDERGRVFQSIDINGGTTTSLYSMPGAWADAHVINLGYQQDWIEDANGSLTLNTYDVFGRLVWVGQKDDGGVCSALQVTTYDYDVVNNLTQVVRGGRVCGDSTVPGSYTPGNTIVSMSYDSLGRKTNMSDPDMGNWKYIYNPAGALVQQEANRITLPGTSVGNMVCFYYDDGGRLTHKNANQEGTDCLATPATSGPNWLASYSYYGVTMWGPLPGKTGKLQQVQWNRGYGSGVDSENYDYDMLGRLTSHSRSFTLTSPTETFTMQYGGFDGLHRPTVVTYPDGKTTTIGYDKEGENSLTLGGTGTTGILVNDVRYNERGQMTFFGRELGGHDTTYTYYNATNPTVPGNANYRLQSIAHGHTTLPEFVYSYDLVGNIAQIQEPKKSETTNFTYDHLNRLISTSGLYNHTYSYDYLGNLVNKNGTTLTYDSSHPHAVDTAGNMSFGYDLHGNMLTRQVGAVSYDQDFDVENRLVKVEENNGQITRFFYDPNGQRTMTIQPNGTVVYTPFPNYEKETGPYTIYTNGFEPSDSFVLTEDYTNFPATDVRTNNLASTPRTGTKAVGFDNLTNGYVSTPELEIFGTRSYTIQFYARGNFDANVIAPNGGWRVKALLTQGGSSLQTPSTVQEQIIYSSTAIPSAWTFYSFNINAPGGYSHIIFYVESLGQNGWIAVDDLLVKERTTTIYTTGFESGAGTTWFYGTMSSATSILNEASAASISAPRSGTRAVAISNLMRGWVHSSFITVGAGTSYNVSVYARGQINSNGSAPTNLGGKWYIRVFYYDTNNQPLAGTPSADIYSSGTVPSTWTNYTYSFVPPAGTAKIKIGLGSEMLNGWVAFDTISLGGFFGGSGGYSTGFEDNQSNWTVAANSVFPATSIWRSNTGITAPQSGSKAIAINNLLWGWVDTGSIAVQAGQPYTANWYTRGQNSSNQGKWITRMTYYNSSGGQVGVPVDLVNTTTYSANWTLFTANFTPPTGATQAKLSVRSELAGGWLAVDDVVITKLQTITRKTYTAAGQPVAIEVAGSAVAAENGLFFIYTDHLGSANTLMKSNGTIVNDTRFYPFGEYRLGSGSAVTDRGFTGHKHNDELGLIYMNARFYVPGVGKFASADTIVPIPTNPQTYNRYSYVYNNPINLNDPTGHCGADTGENAGEVEELYYQCVEARDDYEEYYGVEIGGMWKYSEMLVLGLALQDLEVGLGGIDYFKGLFAGLEINRVNQRLTAGGGFAAAYDTASGLIEFANETFAYGESLARFIMLHETFHILDYKSGHYLSQTHLETTGATCEFGGIYNCVNYAPGSDAFSGGQSRGPLEEPADTFAGFMYRGNWSDLINARPSGIQVVYTGAPFAKPLLPGQSSRFDWGNYTVAYLKGVVNASFDKKYFQ